MARGKLRVTEELLKRVLHLPENVSIKSIDVDSDRDIYEIHLRSSEPVKGLTFKTVEGASSTESSHHI